MEEAKDWKIWRKIKHLRRLDKKYERIIIKYVKICAWNSIQRRFKQKAEKIREAENSRINTIKMKQLQGN